MFSECPKIFSQFWKEKTGETKMFPIIVVSPLELIRTQQVARLTANGINSVSLECCEISDIEEKEIVEI